MDEGVEASGFFVASTFPARVGAGNRVVARMI
jgi:hypothetical protein